MAAALVAVVAPLALVAVHEAMTRGRLPENAVASATDASAPKAPRSEDSDELAREVTTLRAEVKALTEKLELERSGSRAAQMQSRVESSVQPPASPPAAPPQQTQPPRQTRRTRAAVAATTAAPAPVTESESVRWIAPTHPAPESVAASQDVKAIPEVIKVVPEVVKTAPEVAKDGPEVTKATPEVTKAAPEVVKPVPEVKTVPEVVASPPPPRSTVSEVKETPAASAASAAPQTFRQKLDSDWRTIKRGFASGGEDWRDAIRDFARKVTGR